MKFNVSHLTRYSYSKPVLSSYNESRLTPRSLPGQTILSSHYQIHPKPDEMVRRLDIYGNIVYYFTIQQYHQSLSVKAVCEVEVNESEFNRSETLAESWEITGRKLSNGNHKDWLLARQFTLDSPHVAISPELLDYARPSFSPNRSIIMVVTDLMNRIYQDFKFDTDVTNVATSLKELLRVRRGVCQDFAHLAIGCLRSMRFAARYVSGYIETIPPPGKPKLVGVDASHAWVSVFIPDHGWIDFDPTNNLLHVNRHITLAWGRDFSDVTPLKGVIDGGGRT
jgi:transglutaminase-like putative cysteine protease